MSDHGGFRYCDSTLRSQHDFVRMVVPKPRTGNEGWPGTKPRAFSNKAMGRKGRLVSKELGLSHDEEVGHFDHVVEYDVWKATVGPDHVFEHTGATLPKVATLMLRRGEAHTPLAMNAMC